MYPPDCAVSRQEAARLAGKRTASVWDRTAISWGESRRNKSIMSMAAAFILMQWEFMRVAVGELHVAVTNHTLE